MSANPPPFSQRVNPIFLYLIFEHVISEIERSVIFQTARLVRCSINFSLPQLRP
jgi:hypothetical protein